MLSATTVTIPHKFSPRPYQLPFLRAMDSGAKRAVLVWHRRSGKDLTTWNYTVKRAAETPGLYFYFLPTYTQAKKVIWDGIDARTGIRFLDHIPRELRTQKPNETEMKVELRNGSIIQLIGADNIDRIVGTNPIGCVFSEYSLMKPNVWDYIRPILAENGGWAVFIYTPRGMNHGWKLLQQGKEDGWFVQVSPVEETQAIPSEVLESERKQMPQDLYEQEYQCKFVEGAGAFFRGVDRNVWSGDLVPAPGHSYRLGVDLAKHQDWTVLTPFSLNTFQAGKQEKFQQLDYTLQKARIEATCRRYNLAFIRQDSTGVGEPIYDDLNNQGLPIEGYKFTEKSRTDLLNNLRILLEQDKIKIPNDPELLDQLRSFQYTLTEQGRTKIVVPEGIHDDMVFSLALAVWDIPPIPLGTAGIEDEFKLYDMDMN
jgi:hypothetical protein